MLFSDPSPLRKKNQSANILYDLASSEIFDEHAITFKVDTYQIFIYFMISGKRIKRIRKPNHQKELSNIILI
jgi:hypothetical protein